MSNSNKMERKGNDVVVNQEKVLALAKKKEEYEASGIPVGRLLFCHGLPMTD